MAKNLSTAEPALSTAQRILAAARDALLESGFAALSTRSVAERAGVPLSQIHYHFGSKEQLILAMLGEENDALVRRQAQMFGLDLPLAERWNLACDYLDDDLDSGYVRVLQEMMAAGWSSTEVRDAVGELLGGWTSVLTDAVEAGRAAGDSFGAFGTAEIVALVMSAFLGAESIILLGLDRDQLPIRGALRRVGEALTAMESRR
ncbi:MAG: TetR/AcrR family transcriptional regulator [Actinomycetota bacterium]|nr:TetR/AcrR family transcriptional regulator [Actinomycetota bacterium]